MPVKIYKAKISTDKTIAKDVRLLKVSLTPPDRIEFLAGQFVNILVAPSTRRSYSIASSPGDNASIDLIADTVLGGPGSQFFANAHAGMDVEFLGPMGNFVYQEDNKPAYFFATGTGVVPFISMITYALETLNSVRPMKLFLGFRHEESIFYREYFEGLQAKFPNFEFILTLSQPEASWQGKRGRISEHYPQIVAQDRNFNGYVCGSRQMIDDVVLRLTDSGVSKENIFYEQYY